MSSQTCARIKSIRLLVKLGKKRMQLENTGRSMPWLSFTLLPTVHEGL